MPDDRRCRRCDIPHSESEAAKSNGGIGRYFEWDGDLCPICLDYREERRRDAHDRYLAWLRNRSPPEQADLRVFADD